MVGWRSKVWKKFNLHERPVGPYRHRLYTAVSRHRVAAAWRAWATGAARAVAFRAGAAGLAAGAAYYGYKYFRKRRKMTGEPSTALRPGKRARTDAGTQYVQDRGANYLQLTHAKGYGGKKLSKTEKKLKIIGAHMNSQIERFQGLSVQATYGYYPLNIVNNGVVPTQGKNLPVYIIDLSSIVNFATIGVGAVPAVHVPDPMWRMQANDNGVLSWVPQPGTSAASGGPTRFCWQIERSGRNQALSNGHNFISMGDKAMIEWLDFRFLFYGARDRPSSVNFKIIQFTDTDFVPPVAGTNVAGVVSQFLDNDAVGIANTEPEYAKYQTFWQQHLDMLIGNPIGKRGIKEYDMRNNTHVYCDKTFDFQPIDNGEADSTGHQVDYHYFHRVNKVFDYVSDPQADALNDDDALENQNVYPVYINNKVAPFVNKKGRMYALISGFNIQDSTGEAPPGRFGPSFDLILRRKTSIIRN